MFTGTPYPMGKEYHYPKVRSFILNITLITDNLWFFARSVAVSLSFSAQAGEENPVITLYVVNLNGPLHTIEMRRPDDPRIG